MLRFALGVAELTRERLGAVLSACAAAAPPMAREPTAASSSSIHVRDVALGLLSDAMDGARETPALVRARRRRLSASSRRRAARFDRMGKLVGRIPGVPRALGRCRAWRDRGRMQLARWAELGRRKQAENRALAFDALAVLRENLLARVAESPDVKAVIREQSEGIAVTAIGELRERSARADSLVEQTVGRLLGRGRASRPR